MGKTILNRDEIEAMILAKVRTYKCGENIVAVSVKLDIDAHGLPSFTVERLRPSSGPVLPDAQRVAIAEANRLNQQFALVQAGGT